MDDGVIAVDFNGSIKEVCHLLAWNKYINI